MLSRRTFLTTITGTYLCGAASVRPLETASPSAAVRFSVRPRGGVPTIFHYLQPVVPIAHFALTRHPRQWRISTARGLAFSPFI